MNTWTSRLAKFIGPISLAQAILSYFVGRILDRLIAEPSREIVQPGIVIDIDRPGSGWDIIIYYLVSAIIVWVLSWYVQRETIRRKGQAVTVKDVIFCILKILLIIIIIIFLAFSLSKIFLIPKVAPKMVVSGHVYVPQSYNYLFVRPVDSHNCWLQEPIPLIPRQDGGWYAGAFFGGGSGQQFEIIAISSQTPLHPIPFSGPGSYECTRIPNNAIRFVRLAELR